ncbi:MAG: hypothetical protein E4G89_02885 [Methanothrix sp.]|nr:MAG: hypothetical protein E4G89_02885 [Methanothrix sp.]
MTDADNRKWRERVALVRIGNDHHEQEGSGTEDQSILNSRGRPTKYNEEAVKNVAGMMGEHGLTFRQALGGYAHRSTFWRWTKLHPGLKRLMEEARRRRKYWWQVRYGQDYNRYFRNGKQPRGRRPPTPRKYSEDQCERVAHSLRMTARALGVSKATVCRWKHLHPEFDRAMVRAWVEDRIPRIEKKLEASMRNLERLDARQGSPLKR